MDKPLLRWEQVDNRELKCGPYHIFRVVWSSDIGNTYLALKYSERGVEMLGQRMYDNSREAKQACETDWEKHAYQD